MHPDWPRSDADLVPLPLCDGPKVKAFDFGGAQNIEFLEQLGHGTHGHVFKVKINDELYALKLFRFLFENDWIIPSDDQMLLDRKIMSVFYNFAEPFNNELRAFGRLQEAGYEHLAVKCYGYLLLDQAHEDKLRRQFPGISFMGSGLEEVDDDPFGPLDPLDPLDVALDARGHFKGRDGRSPPIRGIVKKLGRMVDESGMTNKSFTTLRRNVRLLHRLGIMSIDIAASGPCFDQYVDDMQLCDFSVSVTVPHFMTNPEMNPALTAKMKRIMEAETFRLVSSDLFDFDSVVKAWNGTHGAKKGHITVRAFPNGNRCSRLQQLRSKKLVVCTSFDPRRYAWDKPCGAGPRTLAKMSETWRFDCLGDERLATRLSKGSTSAYRWLKWGFANEHIFLDV
ncbi:hypothetical protein RB595_010155 [Gaeumannomyces hyphopodioides]